jgi:AcrR family transcriptional regulator
LTSIDALCKATGVLRGSLYSAFGDKRGILIAALDHYAEQNLARLAERLRSALLNCPPLRGRGVRDRDEGPFHPRLAKQRTSARSFGVVETDTHRVSVPGAQPADAMAEIDPVRPSAAFNGSMVDGENDTVPLF